VNLDKLQLADPHAIRSIATLKLRRKLSPNLLWRPTCPAWLDSYFGGQFQPTIKFLRVRSHVWRFR